MPAASASVTTRRPRAINKSGDTPKGVTRKLRNQGGATVFSIPAHFLSELGIQAGADVEVSLVDGKLVAEPKVLTVPRRKRYTLAELLEGAERLHEFYAGTEGALDGPSLGLEMG